MASRRVGAFRNASVPGCDNCVSVIDARIDLSPIVAAMKHQPIELGLKVKQMIKPKRSAEQQVADEADRRALHPLATRQTIADSQAAPEFQENLKRLKAERIAREAGLKTKGK